MTVNLQVYDRERDRSAIERPLYLVPERVISEVTRDIFRKLNEVPFLHRLFNPCDQQDLSLLSLKKISLLCRGSGNDGVRLSPPLGVGIIDQTRQLLLFKEDGADGALAGLRYFVDILESGELGEKIAIVDHARARLLSFYYLALLVSKQEVSAFQFLSPTLQFSGEEPACCTEPSFHSLIRHLKEDSSLHLQSRLSENFQKTLKKKINSISSQQILDLYVRGREGYLIKDILLRVLTGVISPEKGSQELVKDLSLLEKGSPLYIWLNHVGNYPSDVKLIDDRLRDELQKEVQNLLLEVATKRSTPVEVFRQLARRVKETLETLKTIAGYNPGLIALQLQGCEISAPDETSLPIHWLLMARNWVYS